MIISQANNAFLDLREEDNLSIVDKIAGPNVSSTQKCHCYGNSLLKNYPK